MEGLFLEKKKKKISTILICEYIWSYFEQVFFFFGLNSFQTKNN